MFAIRLLPPNHQDADEEHMGEIVVGGFRERFVCHSVGGATSDLTADWRAELIALARGAPVAVLRHDPRLAWLVYRDGDDGFVQQRFSADGAFGDLLPLTLVTEDGDAVSTWVTSVAAIRRFLDAEPGAAPGCCLITRFVGRGGARSVGGGPVSIQVEAVTSESIRLGDSVIGYQVHFVAGTVRGQAWFATADGQPPAVAEYAVETGMQSLRGFRVVTRSDEGTGITPLPTPGDYRVRGIVEAVLGASSDQPPVGAYVRAGDWSFMIDANDWASGEPNALGGLVEGDEVEFEVVGLSLWDENV